MVQPDRRKIRKGTKSCWECKRRKTRCIFSENQTCAGCRRRGTQCISQERPDPGSLSQPGDRLARIEGLLDRLLDRISGNSLDSSSNSAVQSRDSVVTPNAVLPQLPISLQPTFISPSTIIPNQTSARHDEIRTALLEAWPSDGDIEIILCNSIIKPHNSSHGLVSAFCTPELNPKAARQQRLSRGMLRLPPSGSHPVLYARQLMILGSCLQVASPPPPSSEMNTITGKVNFDDLMFRVIELARTLVNSNDEMVGSIEGIESIAMEAMYHAYTGDLHRAWLTLRRAILIAQTMGLHRGIHPPSITTDGHYQPSSDSIQLWFNLIHLDRYPSLMIGLPQSSSDSPFATPTELEACRDPEERLRRLDCASAGRILEYREKKQNALNDNDQTILEIDTLLQEAAACMPARWWLHGHHHNHLSESEETAVLNQHVRHYHLLAQLHWPSLLSSNENKNPNHEYSKLTAINASRQALSCYIALANTSSSAVYHSPSLNHIAPLASTALCLAYLDININNQHGDNKHNSSAYAASFTHQRHSDRGMMEQALESMQRMMAGRLSSDTTSGKIRDTFQRLLDIDEASADRGIKYSFRLTSSRQTKNAQLGAIDGLRIDIPPYETIVIERSNDDNDNDNDNGRIWPNLNLDVNTVSDDALLSSCDYHHMPDDLANLELPNFDDTQEWMQCQ